MSTDEYLDDIRKKCEALGVWRDEYERVAERLANIYRDIVDVAASYRASGGEPVIEMEKNGSVKPCINPHLVELGALRDQALACERELGLTPASLRKINEEALKPKRRNGLENALRLLEG